MLVVDMSVPCVGFADRSPKPRIGQEDPQIRSKETFKKFQPSQPWTTK
jgi:hypothetical protein